MNSYLKSKIKMKVGFVVLVVFAIMSLRCNLSNNNEANQNDKDEKYIFIKYHFYKDTIGNLYEKKFYASDGENPERQQFYDSTMILKEYPNRIALKKIIDIESYKEFDGSPFSNDKSNVYYYVANSDGGYRFIVKGANPKTFIPLEYRWGKDDKNVFFQSQKVKGADLKTFKVNQLNQDSAFDNKARFYNGEKVKNYR